MILASDNYEQIIKSAIALGNDTDITAAIVGALTGVYFGIDSITERMYLEYCSKPIVYPFIVFVH